MSTFVKLNKQDAYVSSYISHKRWIIDESDFNSYGIQATPAVSSSGDIYISSPITSEEESKLLYKSIQHLYYREGNTSLELDEEGYVDLASYTYEHYTSTTLVDKDIRVLEDKAFVIQIPANVVGSGIKPTSFLLSTRNPFGDYILPDYIDTDYVLEGTALPGQGNTVDNYMEDGYVEEGYVVGSSAAIELTLIDDGEGNILDADTLEKVGDIIYAHGMVILTDITTATYFIDQVIVDYRLYYKSTKEILTSTYRCKVRESQLNATYNKTAYDETTGELKTNVQNTYFEPYVTTIGLYNDAHELVAVAKLSKPHPKSQYIDTTFVVSLDV